jgi:hypothetical protein
MGNGVKGRLNRADCYILPLYRPDSVLRGLSAHGRVCFVKGECVWWCVNVRGRRRERVFK